MLEMKDSGINWAGNIPQNWSVMPIKYLKANEDRAFVDGPFGSNLKSEHFVDNGEVYVIESGCISTGKFIFKDFKTITNEHFLTINRSECKENDIIIAKIGANYGMAAELPLLDKKSVVSGNSLKLTLDSEKMDNYLFVREMELAKKNGGFISIVNETAQPALSLTVLNNFRLVVPPVNEQKAISNYLKLKCEEIDELLAEIQAEIDTLEKYKRSVITEKVTKGLNPDVAMKDSGVGWMPKVPSHWNVSKLKYYLKRQTIKNHDDATVLSLYREYGVIPKDSREDNHNVTSEDTSKYLYVKKGDFVINKMKAWQGSVAVSNYNGIVSPAYYVYEFSDESIYKDYFHYLMRNKMYAIEFRRLSGGIREGQWDLSAVSLENILILIPPYNEQVAIAEYLNKTMKEIEEIINRKKEQLAVLEEYKKAIIYEYVTGKKEVHA